MSARDSLCQHHDRHRPYRLSCEQFRALAARAGGLCEICGIKPIHAIDHDHALDIAHVRGLLCHSCNVALAQVDRGRRPPTPSESAYLKNAWHLEHGAPPPPTRRVPKVLRSVSVRPYLLAQVEDRCEDEGLTFNDAVERALEAWVRSSGTTE